MSLTELFPNSRDRWNAYIAITKHLGGLVFPASAEAIGRQTVNSGVPGGFTLRLGYYSYSGGCLDCCKSNAVDLLNVDSI